MKHLEFLAFTINTKCNLNCKSCNGAAPLVQYEDFWANFEIFKKSVKKLKECAKIDYVEIMGGEPLLNDRVMEYVEYASNVYADTDTIVVLYTNGILLKKFLTRENVKLLQRDNVKIFFSVYPINYDYETLFKLLDALKIKYKVMSDWKSEEQNNEDDYWIQVQLNECGKYTSRCHCYAADTLWNLMIKDDILYHCSYAMNCSTLNKAFGTNFQLTKKRLSKNGRLD